MIAEKLSSIVNTLLDAAVIEDGAEIEVELVDEAGAPLGNYCIIGVTLNSNGSITLRASSDEE